MLRRAPRAAAVAASRRPPLPLHGGASRLCRCSSVSSSASDDAAPTPAANTGSWFACRRSCGFVEWSVSFVHDRSSSVGCDAICCLSKFGCCCGCSDHMGFIRDVAAIQPPKLLPELLRVLVERGQWVRNAVHMHLRVLPFSLLCLFVL